MGQITFDVDLPVPPPEPARTDVACFVGLVRVRGEVSISQRAWLVENGWVKGPYARPLDGVLDVPVPVESFAAFQALYDDGSSRNARGTDYLALSVRAFFAQGGKKAYIVRAGDPWDGTKPRADPLERLDRDDYGAANNPSTWRGPGHLFGLPDVSFLLLPDLPLLHATDARPAVGVVPDPAQGPEEFVECEPGEQSLPDAAPVFPAPAPRLNEGAYADWAKNIRRITRLLTTDSLREVQLVAALPLPFAETAARARRPPT